ncbi:hypothetical protein BT67DRAFT_452215 [Trichocladium antarcticum]|uniref:Spindle pole body component n=1 Tax=Trichocladium antarcticum TaxID=1450529 RepID=A0AAN6ZAL7_9PEZI|nr:hypothetical protein BT67DRAFT_452215 [Trichocladium antarcticum]
MASRLDLSDLFAVPDFWQPSSWLDKAINDINDIKTQNPLFALDAHGLVSLGLPPLQHSPGLNVPYSGVENEDDAFFKLPPLLKELVDLDIKRHAKSGIQEPAPEPSLDDGDGDGDGDDDDDDFWLSPIHDYDARKPPEYRTWENFEHDTQGSQSPLFITEAGPAAFDAWLASKQNSDGIVPDVLDSASYCACLLSLALGRGSILFSWDTDKNSFVKTAAHLRISGLSLVSVTAVDSLCLDCGNSSRHLEAFAEATYSAARTPTRVALAGVVDRLVQVVRSELSTRSRDLRSILQLQSVVRPAQLALSYFKCLVKKLAQQKSDEAMLSCLFQEAQASEYRDRLLREATREVLRILSKPWTDFVEEWVGLRAEERMPMSKQGPGKGFVKVADRAWIDDQGFELGEPDYFLDEKKVPTFVPGEMAQAMFETGRNLRFIREHHPEHPLSRPDTISLTTPPSLEWEFDWGAISKLEARVDQYRNAVSRAIQGVVLETQPGTPPLGIEPTPGTVELACFGKSDAQVEAHVLASMRQLDQPPDNHGPKDELTLLLRDRLYQPADITPDSGNFSPHWTLVPLLSFGSVIEAQSSIVNQECMKLLFNSHHLRTHIDLLKQYFLLGNGLLCSRLSHALFDPTLETAERQTGVVLGGGTMGLRLGGRQTWPPASSELRLALMGVLSDCYEPPLLPTPDNHPTTNPSSSSSSPPSLPPSSSSSSSSSSKSALPGELSFAVRDLTQPEIDRCMDPDSLEALDFLRLSYKPPAALRPVLSPAVLARYDRVFALLLRLRRMLYVAEGLFLLPSASRGGAGEGEGEGAASLRLRAEARHFVHQVARYFFDVGVAAPWRRFEAWLDRVEVESGGRPVVAAGEAGEREGVLDEVMGVLLLRKRQAPVLGLLEEVFGVVLEFAKGLRLRVGVRGGLGGEDSAEVLYRRFRGKVEVFVTVCRGLGEKMGPGGKGEANTVDQLVLMLDMGGFYGGRKGAGL